MYKIIDNLIIEGNYRKAVQLIDKTLMEDIDLKHRIYLLNAAIYSFLRLYQLDKARVYANRLMSVEKDTKDIAEKASIYHMYGVTLFKQGNMIEAYSNLRKALQYACESKNEKLEVRILDSIGRYYEDDGERQNATYFYKMSEKQKIFLKDNLGLLSHMEVLVECTINPVICIRQKNIFSWIIVLQRVWETITGRLLC